MDFPREILTSYFEILKRREFAETSLTLGLLDVKPRLVDDASKFRGNGRRMGETESTRYTSVSCRCCDGEA